MSYDDEMPGANPDLLLDEDATASGYEGPSANSLEQFDQRRRMLAGDEEGIPLVERLEFHAERGWATPVSKSSALMLEAARRIVELEG